MLLWGSLGALLLSAGELDASIQASLLPSIDTNDSKQKLQGTFLFWVRFI